MTRSMPVTVWPLLVLTPVQAALAASVLSAAPWVWAVALLTAAAWLVWRATRPTATALGLVAGGYLLPLLGYAAVYAALALPARPEVAEAAALLRPPPAVAPPTPSVVPVPKLLPPGDRPVARVAWLYASTAVYLALCAVAGLLWHTPLVADLIAAVVLVVALARPEES